MEVKYLSGIETRERILRVSRKLFFKDGFQETSIRKIAKESDVSSGALYKHFSSKEDILDCIIAPYVEDCWNKCDELLYEFETNLMNAKTAKEIKTLVNHEGASDLFKYMKKDVEIWRFVFCNSAGTKYEHFFDEFMQYEVDVALKILGKFDPEKNYLKVASDTEIYFFIKGFYNMGLSVFDSRFDDEKRVNFFKIIEEMYQSFWEKLFLINY